MAEYDLDAYRRKFLDTLTVFKKKDDTLFSGYVQDMSETEYGPAFKIHKIGWFKPDETKVKALDPQYFRFGGRFYTNGETTFSIRRRLKKSYKIGLCDDNYIIRGLNNPLDQDISAINPFKEVPVDVAAALKKEGPISKNLYITKNAVLLLDREVGLRKGSNFIVNESVAQEIKDCLQGFECKISL